MKKTLFIFCILNTLASFGQDDPVIVIADADRHVDKVRRSVLSPEVIDTIIPTAIVEYPLLSLQYETGSDVDKINPASINVKEKLPQLYSTYVKVGVGSELMPLGEVFFNSKRSRKFVYGLHAKHLSSFGDIKGYSRAQFDRTSGLLYGGIEDKRYSVLGDVHYNNQGLHYYGVSDTMNLHKDSISQRYSDFGIAGSYASHIKDSAKLNYKIGLAYNNFLSQKIKGDKLEKWRGQENAFDVLSSVFYKHGKEAYAADLNIKYNGYKYGIPGKSYSGLDSGIVLNNTVVNLKPTITTFLFNNRFKANIGVNIVVDVHVTTNAYVYPLAEIKYSMFNDIFIPYTGIRGGLVQNSYKSLTQENEFIRPNIELKNEKTPMEFYGGIKGTLSKRISFDANFSYANVKDKALFVTDTIQSLGNKFNVIYDTMNVAKVEASISYQLKEKIKFDGIGRYYSYSALNNSYAWNLPQFQFILRGTYNLYDKFIFNLDLNLEEGRRALSNANDLESTLENGQRITKFGFLADLNLGVEYRYNKRISAFVEFNNLASQKYKRWYNTPVHAFQVLGGVTFRF
tara:strand:+ start:37 stop:1743 length:1707 start_codon:yes stop_codon:yes gene_type:complete